MLAVGIIASLSLACGSDADSKTTPAPPGVERESPTAVRQTQELPETGGTWSSSAPLPTARSEVAAVELDGSIYVFGGFGSAGTAKMCRNESNASEHRCHLVNRIVCFSCAS